MTTFNTGNPIGSVDPRDLYDNAENLDTAVNTKTDTTWTDRLGVERKTFHGMEVQFDSQQVDFEDRFNVALQGIGYEQLGDYAAGLEITEYNQIFRHDGEWWRAAATTELPYTTTGDWGAEGDLFVGIGDALLREELADNTDPSKGAALIGRGVEVVGSFSDLLEIPVGSRKETSRYLVGDSFFIWDGADNRYKPDGLVTLRAFGAIEGEDAAAAFQAAFDFLYPNIRLRVLGNYLLESVIPIPEGARVRIEGVDGASSIKSPASLPGMFEYKGGGLELDEIEFIGSYSTAKPTDIGDATRIVFNDETIEVPSEQIIVNSCRFTKCIDGFGLQIPIAANVDQIIFRNNVFSECVRTGARIEFAEGFGCDYVVFEGNQYINSERTGDSGYLWPLWVRNGFELPEESWGVFKNNVFKNVLNNTGGNIFCSGLVGFSRSVFDGNHYENVMTSDTDVNNPRECRAIECRPGMGTVINNTIIDVRPAAGEGVVSLTGGGIASNNSFSLKNLDLNTSVVSRGAFALRFRGPATAMGNRFYGYTSSILVQVRPSLEGETTTVIADNTFQLSENSLTNTNQRFDDAVIAIGGYELGGTVNAQPVITGNILRGLSSTNVGINGIRIFSNNNYDINIHSLIVSGNSQTIASSALLRVSNQGSGQVTLSGPISLTNNVLRVGDRLLNNEGLEGAPVIKIDNNIGQDLSAGFYFTKGSNFIVGDGNILNGAPFSD